MPSPASFGVRTTLDEEMFTDVRQNLLHDRREACLAGSLARIRDFQRRVKVPARTLGRACHGKAGHSSAQRKSQRERQQLARVINTFHVSSLKTISTWPDLPASLLFG